VSTAIVRDDYGEPVSFDVVARRIVSLNPTTTETLFAMHHQAQLVGRSRWDVWPDSARLIPNLGDALRPNVEAVIAARPDLVILYGSADNRPAAERFKAAGIRVVAFKIDRVATFDRVTRILGRLVGDTAAGNIVADSVQRTLHRVATATASLPHPTVVWPFAYRPAMVVGGGSFMTELLDVAGAHNIYGDMREPSPVVTLEDVVRRNPTYVIRSVDNTQLVTQPTKIDPAWSAIDAVRQGRVLIAPAELVARPSVRMGEGALALARLLHPGTTFQ